MVPQSRETTTCLVTGAVGGIGAAVAAALATIGHPVAVLDRDDRVVDTAERLRADGATSHAIVADVTDADAVRAAVDTTERHLGPIGVLANVAGILRTGPIFELTDEDWMSCLAVNATGVWNTGRAVGQRMRDRGTGSIVTVASNAASVPRVGMAPYAASKAAAVMVTRCLALELAPHVRCNIVCPGSTDTAMLRSMWSDPEDDRGAATTVAGSPEQFKLGIPLGRIATPGDIAEAVVWLAGEGSRHVTMQSITVDGGATLGV